MFTKKKIGTGLVLLGLLSGCGEKYLEEAPRDATTTENFYQTQSDAVQATNAVYAELIRRGMLNLSLWAIGDVGSDNSLLGGGGGNDGIEQQQLDNYSIPPTNPLTTGHWQSCYLGIGRANVVLQKVPGITGMDATIQKRCLGEAQFLRALYYFYLVRAFGDVPLITTPPATATEVNNLARTPVAQVYQQIITDLKAAADNLPASYSGDDIGRATKWSAAGLLAKVYLTQGDKASAATQALMVINQSGKVLNASYASNFDINNENGPESLFEGQFRTSNEQYYDLNGPGFCGNDFFGARGLNTVPTGGYGFNIPEKEFVDGYEPGDLRKGVTVWVPGDVYPTGQVQPASAPGSTYGFNIRKWYTGKLSARQYDSPLNIPILRMADVYLIYAEAAGPAAGLEYLNKVRRRAFGLPINTPSATRDLNITDAAAYQAAVLRERRYELAFENDRWYDLVRTKTLVPTMRAKNRPNVQDFNLVLPIPQSERDVNPNLTQNPGY